MDTERSLHSMSPVPGLLNVPKLVEGYPTLAQEMGLFPEFAIFRRFATLNVQNLLYRQAEIVMLEEQYRALEHTNDGKARNQNHRPNAEAWFATDWEWLGCADPANEQWKQFINLRTKLEEYNSIVLQQEQLARLPDPGRHDLEYLQQRFRNCIDTNQQAALAGRDRTIWGDPDVPSAKPSDLFVLRPRSTEDPFTSWVSGQLLRWLYQELWCRLLRFQGKEPKVFTFREATLIRGTALVTTVVASMLPVGSIAILNRVDSVDSRLGLLAGFTFLFALCLVCFTTAKRTDVFAATAAFAAVQVVFISNNGGQQL